MGVTTHVCVPNPAANAPDKAYNLSEFIHHKSTDTYQCPAGETLKTNGNWYQKKSYRVKQYKTPKCKNCPVKSSCTKSKSQRIIERHEFAEALEINKENIAKNPEIYAQRQAIVEHPFGTIKRQWGFDHIMTKKTIKHATADVGFIFIAYNLKRIMNIIGIEKLMLIINPFNSKYPFRILKNTIKTLLNLKIQLKINYLIFLHVQHSLPNFKH